MKKHLIVVIAAVLVIAGCGPSGYTNGEIRSLLPGQWKFSSSFDKTEKDMQTRIRSEGKVTFKPDGTMVSEGETLLTITLPEGLLPIHYAMVVNGRWFVEDHALHTTRTSEAITAKDAISDKFINDERMKKIRSEAPTEMTTYFGLISPAKIIASRPDGFHFVYTREVEPPSVVSIENRKIEAIPFLIEKLSKDPVWRDGKSPLLALPATSSIEELVAATLKRTEFKRGLIDDYQIEETKTWEIVPGTKEIYRIARISSSQGGKFLIFRHMAGGWWTKTFDVREEVSRAIDQSKNLDNEEKPPSKFQPLNVGRVFLGAARYSLS